MYRRLLTYSILGGSAIGIGFSLKNSNFDLNNVGIVRLSRAAKTAFDVTLTYKRELFYRDWDRTSIEYKKERSRVHKIAAQKLLELICINKGVYIKVGQHIGGLEYLLPTEYVQTMKVLHSNAPQNSVQDIYKVIRQDLKINAEELFDNFETKPLGTASLAQVHKATLKSGEVVAVKVQHPYVKGNSRVDMKTMELLVHLLSYIFPDFNIQWLVDETKKNLPVELDFLNEGKNAEKVAEQFKNFKWLKIPKIYWQHSTQRVLVMEFLEGAQVTDIEYIKNNKIDPFQVANKIGKLYSEMIFTTGFVHSDPHPGNILVHKNSKGYLDIVLLDHGLYANLTDKFRWEYSKLWLSIMQMDRAGMRDHSANLGIKGDLYGLFACMVTGRTWDSLMQGINKIKFSTEEKETLQSNTALVLPDIADVLAQMDRQMLLILKTNDLIRGIEATLKTQNRMTAFWVMSKCCVKSSFNERRKRQKQPVSRTSRLLLTLAENWHIFKLNVYYLYLGISNYGFFQVFKQIL